MVRNPVNTNTATIKALLGVDAQGKYKGVGNRSICFFKYVRAHVDSIL